MNRSETSSSSPSRSDSSHVSLIDEDLLRALEFGILLTTGHIEKVSVLEKRKSGQRQRAQLQKALSVGF